jgi:hypothetical protein
MKGLHLCIVLCCISILVSAQVKSKATTTYSLTWNNGQVVFYTGDTVACSLRYNQFVSNGSLQVLRNDTVITLSARDVTTFSFFDLEKERYRKFAVLPIAASGQSCFVECLYNDTSFTIISHKTVDVPYAYMNYSRFIGKPIRLNKKYILNESTGELLPLSKDNVLHLMQRHRREILSFIHDNNIKFKRTADYIDVFRYHDSL